VRELTYKRRTEEPQVRTLEYKPLTEEQREEIKLEADADQLLAEVEKAYPETRQVVGKPVKVKIKLCRDCKERGCDEVDADPCYCQDSWCPHYYTGGKTNLGDDFE